jgi:hypothetical protein
MDHHSLLHGEGDSLTFLFVDDIRALRGTDL